jgi:glycosyltransferase involved in cell wall biosynthesis
MEALASGCPVLVSDIPGNREWVTEEIQGWLFPDGDAEALAERILVAVKNKHKLVEMRQAARQTAEQRADWQKNSAELLRAYQLALSS